MKNVSLFILVIVLIGTWFAVGQNNNTNSEGGIIFHQGTWEEALALAKKQQKPIFLDIYATWCGPCKMLKSRTFPNSEVGTFFNKNFINVQFDGEKGEGVMLAQKYGVRAYPSLLFFDENGNLSQLVTGYHNAGQFLRLGEQVLEKQKQ